MATDKFVTKEQLSEILNSVNNFKNVPETVVGKWVDGKPIYQTVIEKEISTYTDSQVRRDFNVASISGVSSVVDAFGYVQVMSGPSNGIILPIEVSTFDAPASSSSTRSYASGMTVNISSNTLSFIARFWTVVTWCPTKIKAYIVLRYTKV